MQGQNVAPLAGAWIETPLRVREPMRPHVAPLAGAWIETSSSMYGSVKITVAPLAGAWIETDIRNRLIRRSLRRAPRGRVD